MMMMMKKKKNINSCVMISSLKTLLAFDQ